MPFVYIYTALYILLRSNVTGHIIQRRLHLNLCKTRCVRTAPGRNVMFWCRRDIRGHIVYIKILVQILCVSKQGIFTTTSLSMDQPMYLNVCRHVKGYRNGVLYIQRLKFDSNLFGGYVNSKNSICKYSCILLVAPSYK